MKLEITFRHLVVELMKDWVNVCICSTLFILTAAFPSFVAIVPQRWQALLGNLRKIRDLLVCYCISIMSNSN